MDNHWIESCPICDAPLHTHEFAGHFAMCLKIQAKRTGRTDAELTVEIAKNIDRLLTSGEATKAQPVPHSQRPWGAWGGPALPVGKTLCPGCNGLTQMYPECGVCDARGWVD